MAARTLGPWKHMFYARPPSGNSGPAGGTRTVAPVRTHWERGRPEALPGCPRGSGGLAPALLGCSAQTGPFPGCAHWLPPPSQSGPGRCGYSGGRLSVLAAGLEAEGTSSSELELAQTAGKSPVHTSLPKSVTRGVPRALPVGVFMPQKLANTTERDCFEGERAGCSAPSPALPGLARA